MENIQQGLLLMVVGMTTVFLILLLVIYISKGLIAFVNKYAPEEAVQKKPVQTVAQAIEAVPAATTAAIVSAVSTLTGGKGKVTKIEKL
ncbi:MAG: OadG family protein [Tannerellaceae bacterium]|nr:OadG family protein [Tannerellaceae bacterium]